MTARARRWPLFLWLIAPLAAVPALAFALMEWGPERSFMFAGYLLVWALGFLAAGLVLLWRRPAATARAVLGRAALWGVAVLGLAVGILFVLSLLIPIVA